MLPLSAQAADRVGGGALRACLALDKPARSALMTSPIQQRAESVSSVGATRPGGRVLHKCLAGDSVKDFTRLHLGRRAFAHVGGAEFAEPLGDWSALERLLSMQPAPDMLLIAGGQLQERPEPRSLSELKALFDDGIGIVVRDAQHRSPALRALCESFALELPGRQRLFLFATPKHRHGFGWHYDAEDVFILQTAGEKQYLMRENTIDRPRPGVQPDFTCIRRETSPLMSCTLLPGDWLYLPSGMWHVAQPLTDSLSISLGIMRSP